MRDPVVDLSGLLGALSSNGEPATITRRVVYHTAECGADPYCDGCGPKNRRATPTQTEGEK